MGPTDPAIPQNVEAEKTTQNTTEEKEIDEAEKQRLSDELKARRHGKPCSVTPENFNVCEFNTNMAEFISTLEQQRFSTVDKEYPVQELNSVVALVAKSVKDYKLHTTDSQRQLEALTASMRRVRENLH